jgi:hypothetical protein
MIATTFLNQISNSNQKCPGELKKKKQLLQFGARKTVKKGKVCSDSTEQTVEVRFDISHLNFNSTKPFTKGDVIENCLRVEPQKLCRRNCTKNSKP